MWWQVMGLATAREVSSPVRPVQVVMMPSLASAAQAWPNDSVPDSRKKKRKQRMYTNRLERISRAEVRQKDREDRRRLNAPKRERRKLTLLGGALGLGALSILTVGTMFIYALEWGAVVFSWATLATLLGVGLFLGIGWLATWYNRARRLPAGWRKIQPWVMSMLQMVGLVLGLVLGTLLPVLVLGLAPPFWQITIFAGLILLPAGYAGLGLIGWFQRIYPPRR
jgi:MFS family permease